MTGIIVLLRSHVGKWNGIITHHNDTLYRSLDHGLALKQGHETNSCNIPDASENFK